MTFSGPLIRFAALLLLCLPPWAGGSALAADKVRLQLKWQHQFQFAGYYAALEKGFYREAGLEVEIIPCQPGEDAAKNVLAGKAEFGVGTTDLLLLREKGEPVVVLATIFQHSPLALVTLRSQGVRTLHDLAGRRLMIEPGSAELFAYLRREGLGEDKFTLLSHGFRINDLADGKVDGMSVYTTDEPFELLQSKQPFVLHSPRTGGIDFYGDNLFTTEQQIRQHPERVNAFRAASLKGWKYAMEHTDEIAGLIHSRYSSRHSLAHLHYEAEQMIPLVRADIVEPGHMYLGRWQHIAAVYAELGMLKPGFDFEGFLYDATPKPINLKALLIGMGIMGFLLFVVVVNTFYTLRTNRLLGASEKRWRQLFDNMPLALIVSDDQHKIIAWNRAATEIFGWTADEALGQDVYCLLIPDDEQEHVRTTMAKTLKEQVMTQSLNRNRTRSGEIITCEWRNTQYYDENGWLGGVISLGADVSQRIRDQQCLQQAKEMAERLLSDHRQFLCMISHEVRSSLAVVDSASQLLNLQHGGESVSSAVITRLRRGVKRLSGFIDNCLTEDKLDRIDQEGWQREDEIIELPAFLGSLIEQAALGASQHSLQLVGAEDSGSYFGDGQLLRVMLHNLLGNACKYSPPGSKVRLHAGRGVAGELRLAVEDEGGGIAPEDLEKVCQRYFRGRNRGQAGGAGLGLFLVERIVKLHHGSLRIDSEVGVGTTITVCLPVLPQGC